MSGSVPDDRDKPIKRPETWRPLSSLKNLNAPKNIAATVITLLAYERYDNSLDKNKVTNFVISVTFLQILKYSR